jgi:tyrosyl-tRNA synthetase
VKDGQSIGLVDLVAKTGLVPSKSEARRLVIVQGGVEIERAEIQTDANAVMVLDAGRQLPYARRSA